MKRIFAALLIVLALSGCAVTGQPAHPGTAAVFDGQHHHDRPGGRTGRPR